MGCESPNDGLWANIIFVTVCSEKEHAEEVLRPSSGRERKCAETDAGSCVIF